MMQLWQIGQAASGGALKINKLAVEADLLIAEGFIESHFLQASQGDGRAYCQVLLLPLR